jgi:hypothetical protein
MAEVILPTPLPTMGGKPIIHEELKSRSAAHDAQFIPEKHLSFKTYPKTISMEEIGQSS